MSKPPSESAAITGLAQQFYGVGEPTGCEGSPIAAEDQPCSSQLLTVPSFIFSRGGGLVDVDLGACFSLEDGMATSGPYSGQGCDGSRVG